ncbi:response regulator [Geotalea toluenoxydans]|uniref:response regulator n=1 Tax=Geotalea toluenoxydans TaxID=421624 RepID=UPI0006D2A582|nr:response regulator [Geotalea toluenoxydans]
MKANKILIVDDQKYARQMLRDILAPLQFVIEEAGDGREAVMKTKDFRPDIILMDLMMPDMSGIEASRLIKSDLQTAPFRSSSLRQARKRTTCCPLLPKESMITLPSPSPPMSSWHGSRRTFTNVMH